MIPPKGPCASQKRKRRSEEEELPVTADVDSLEKVKKTKSQMEEKKKKKKKKKKKRQQETEETTEVKKKKRKHELTDHNHPETEASVSMETSTAGKKKKKKKKGGIVIEGMLQGEKRTGGGRGGENSAMTSSAPSEPLNLLEELQKFLPDVKKTSAEHINRLLKYDLHRFQVFQQKGVSVRVGRLTRQENQQIRDNVEDFLALTGIRSARRLMFPERYPKQEKQIRRLRAKHHFLTSIADGIPRSCQQIYIRAKKMFDNWNYRGRFSEEEVQTLTALQNLYGNDWKTISVKMGRSVFSLEKRFAQVATGRGKWSPEEMSRLKAAVRPYLEGLVQQNPSGPRLSRQQLCRNLPWKEIRHQVGTRALDQCRFRWFTFVGSKMASGVGPFNRSVGAEAKIQLIDTLYNMGVEDIADIDWEKVADSVGDVTTVCVQSKFHRLKVSKVPNWTSLSCGEIIDFLQMNVSPRLKEMLHREERRREAQGEDGYLLSDIFSSAEDDD